MEYVRFDIKNFKGIKALTLDLARHPAGNIYCLVGLNESGKTTVLDAIAYFDDGISDDDAHTLIPKALKDNFNDVVEVTARFQLSEPDRQALKALAANLGFRIVEAPSSTTMTRRSTFKDSVLVDTRRTCDLSLVGRKKGSRHDTQLSGSSPEWKSLTKYIKEKLLPHIAYYPHFLFDFPANIPLSPPTDEQEETYRDVVQDLLDYLKRDLNIDRHLVARLLDPTESNTQSLRAVTAQMEDAMNRLVFAKWDAMYKSPKRRILIEAYLRPSKLEPAPFLSIRIREGTEVYDIVEKSLGFRWFFFFILLTELRMARSQDRGQVLFLLDEPASNLHPTAQARLLDTFRVLGSRSKLIYTTHSHHLVNPEWLEGAHIVINQGLDYENYDDYDAQMTDIVAIPYRQYIGTSECQETYFKPILDALDYAPSRLELVPDLVIVEGKDDFYLLRYAERLLGKSEGFDRLNFYPGTGVGCNDQLIRLYLAWGRSFVVLTDSDESGRSAKQRYCESIGPLVSERIFGLRDFVTDWNGKCTEDLIAQEDRVALVQAVFPDVAGSRKKVLYRAVQELLMREMKVELSEMTVKRFTQLFTGIQGILRGQHRGGTQVGMRDAP